MAESPRVAITGLGTVSCAGIGIDQTWETLLTGKSCISELSVFKPGNFTCKIAGELKDFSAKKYVPKKYRKAIKLMARDIEISVVGSDLAFRDSGIVTVGTGDEMSIEPNRLGCNIAAGLICAELNELGEALVTSLSDGKFDIKKWGNGGINNLTPIWLLKYLPNMLSCHTTIIHGAEGPSNCITCGDAAAQMAVGESAMIIMRGNADAIIAGGAESKLNPMGILRQELLNRICTEGNDSPETALRPFDRDHRGFVVGEGGGLLILERMDRAQNRDAHIYAEMAGFGAACDPKGIDLTRPNAGNLSSAVKKAIADAEMTIDDIDAIYTYGTGLPGEDIAESQEWSKVFGDRLSDIPAVSTTGAVGGLFAGQAGFQLAVAAKAVSEQIVPPTANFNEPFENCKLSLSSEARATEIKNIVVGTFTVGGQSGACVLRRVEN